MLHDLSVLSAFAWQLNRFRARFGTPAELQTLSLLAHGELVRIVSTWSFLVLNIAAHFRCHETTPRLCQSRGWLRARAHGWTAPYCRTESSVFCDSAAERRDDAAMGVSPWTAVCESRLSPNGATRIKLFNKVHVAGVVIFGRFPRGFAQPIGQIRGSKTSCGKLPAWRQFSTLASKTGSRPRVSAQMGNRKSVAAGISRFEVSGVAAAG